MKKTSKVPQNPFKVSKHCRCCKKEFQVYRSQTKHYCSKKCRKQFNGYIATEKLSHNICLVCGALIYRKGSIYCSDRCRKNNSRHPPNFIELEQYNFYDLIKNDIGLEIQIINTDDFVNWIKNNFFLFGLKSIKTNKNIIVFQTASSTGRVEARYFGDGDFSGFAFVGAENSKCKALFRLCGGGKKIRMTALFKKLLESQQIFQDFP